MTVSLATLKANPAKYFDLAKQMDIIVTRHGERVGRIISEETAVSINKHKAFEALMLFSEQPSSLPQAYDDPDYDPNYDLLREEAYKERGLL